jgi:hypothetical protein
MARLAHLHITIVMGSLVACRDIHRNLTAEHRGQA